MGKMYFASLLYYTPKEKIKYKFSATLDSCKKKASDTPENRTLRLNKKA